MKKAILKYSSLIMALSFIYSGAAQAISITYSDKTKKNTVIFDIKGSTNLPFNLYASAGVQLIPFYGDVVGPNPFTNGLSNDFMANPEINVGYNFNLFNAETVVGDFNPTLTPYVGYKHFFAYTPEVTLSSSPFTQSLSNAGGINYGLHFTSSIPLGFFVYADAGATSMLNGSWSQGATTGTVNSNGLFLPHAGVGATFNLFNLLTLRAGYNLNYIPDIRTPNAPLNDASKTLVHSLDLGLSFLFFSI
jgi:hypothetical protein